MGVCVGGGGGGGEDNYGLCLASMYILAPKIIGEIQYQIMHCVSW